MENYAPKMNARETQKALKFLENAFESNFVKNFGFERVSAPLFAKCGTGVNDDLDGSERTVKFDVPALHVEAEVLRSLAKWKRLALKRYGFRSGEGLYAFVHAIRRDYKCDEQHSIYVDQWDWEMVISAEQRNADFLRMVVTRLVNTVRSTLEELKRRYPVLTTENIRDAEFITAAAAADMLPQLRPREREMELAKRFGTVFLMGTGERLADGKPHDNKPPDYDDWRLSGDLIFYDPVIDDSLRIASMGVRVDRDSLLRQLAVTGEQDRLQYPYHKGVVAGTLPLTLGGGVYHSRLAMLLLQKAHIGEVQVGVWSDEMIASCEAKGIHLL